MASDRGSVGVSETGGGREGFFLSREGFFFSLPEICCHEALNWSTRTEAVGEAMTERTTYLDSLARVAGSIELSSSRLLMLGWRFESEMLDLLAKRIKLEVHSGRREEIEELKHSPLMLRES